MRKTASSKADIIDKIPKDTILAVATVDDTWGKCTYNGKEGYIMTKYLSLMDVSQFRPSIVGGFRPRCFWRSKKRLKALYFIDAETALDDRYDSDTEAAVKVFQAANGMEETGIVSPEVQAFLAWGNPQE